MTVETINPARRTAAIVDAEIRALESLVERRNEWLNNPDNRQRKTYEAVKRDSVEMTYKLQELKDELNELETNQ